MPRRVDVRLFLGLLGLMIPLAGDADQKPKSVSPSPGLPPSAGALLESKIYHCPKGSFKVILDSGGTGWTPHTSQPARFIGNHVDSVGRRLVCSYLPENVPSGTPMGMWHVEHLIPADRPYCVETPGEFKCSKTAPPIPR